MPVAKITAVILSTFVAAGACLAAEKNHSLVAKVGERNQKSAAEKPGRTTDSDGDDEPKPWMHTIPLDKRSLCGLPLGLLNRAVFRNDSAKILQILAQAPRRPGDEAERKMWQAAALAMEKRFEQADEAFAKLKNWPDFPCSVKSLMARSYAEDQKYNQAIEILSQVVAKEPSPLAYSDRAGCYASVNKLLQAAHDYESASRLDKFSERTYLVKGANLLVKLGRTQEALAYLERAEKCRRSHPSPALYMVKADCYTKQGEPQKAVDCLNQAEKAAAKGNSRFGSDTDVMLPTILGARAALYKTMGKTDLEKIDRKKLESMTNSLVDDIGGNSDRKKFHK